MGLWPGEASDSKHDQRTGGPNMVPGMYATTWTQNQCIVTTR